MRRRHNVPIAWRVTSGLLTASIVPLLVVAFMAAHRMSAAVKEASYRNLQLTAKITAKNPQSSGTMFGLDFLRLMSQQPAD